MSVKLATQNIRDIAVFERITKVHAKDCIRADSCVYFMIEPGKSGLAIGKNGNVAKSVGRVIGKPVKVFEFAGDVEMMVKNMVPTAKSVEVSGDSVTVSIPETDRSVVIGRNGQNIKAVKEFLKRHFEINYLRLR
ncbi:MAG: NusA-like transcription termination signal-binding factor [Candidatus Aenigmarchaeota archaeon]|nr:NusA-like transcription termination signal-binding factor [Candidatus Aenigmarchaeota archaeon]